MLPSTGTQTPVIPATLHGGAIASLFCELTPSDYPFSVGVH